MAWHTRTVAHPISIISGTHVKSYLHSPPPPRVLPDRFTAAIVQWRKTDHSRHPGELLQRTMNHQGLTWLLLERSASLLCHPCWSAWLQLPWAYPWRRNVHAAWRGRNWSRAGSSKATFTPGGMFDSIWRQCFWFSQRERVPMASPGWRLGMLLRPGSQWGRFIWTPFPGLLHSSLGGQTKETRERRWSSFLNYVQPSSIFPSEKCVL